MKPKKRFFLTIGERLHALHKSKSALIGVPMEAMTEQAVEEFWENNPVSKPKHNKKKP